ncbi:MAG: hypothetical protein H6553_07555 [Chitinophagales bacterium]|nr:hypothetical protein [Chitinophagales bacterium]
MVYLIPLVIIAGIFGYMFYLKKSGKLGAFQQVYVDAEKEVNDNFDKYIAKFKADPNTFKPIIDIIGSDFQYITQCKKPQGFFGALGDTAKTMATGVVVENTNYHLLVIQDNKLHYIEYNDDTKKSAEHFEFDKNSISNLKFEKGKLTDNLKQSMSFKLEGGGRSGDSTDNSDMYKLTFTSNDKTYEFFVYDLIKVGDGFDVENKVGGMGLNQTVDDVVRGQLIPIRLADEFFKNIVNFHS